MRHFIPALSLAALSLAAPPAQAEDLSQEIAAKGIAPTLSRLSALPSPSPEEAFAINGLHFLRAVEVTFQARYAAGVTDRTGMLPFLQLPLPESPSPAPFDPAFLSNLFRAAQAELDQVAPLTTDFALTIGLDDLWFDINANALREPEEGFATLIAPFTAASPGPLPKVTFDTADAAWLAAYAHLLSGLCDLILAYDPTEAMTKVAATKAKLAELGPLTPDPIFGDMNPGGLDFVDLFAVVIETLRREPDPARTASAKAHLLQMVALNRDFWTKVNAETDNQAEWIPNDRQTSALGIAVPQGAGAEWLRVLDDVQALLEGRKLIPWWRIEGAGIDLGAFLDKPAPLDIPGWVQGWSALPYLKQGPLVTAESLDRFDALLQGNAMLFALYFN
ncbi:hypothetical protein [Stagnihabitans tardus]|uniref:Uncharacterized protein n=1 Tax=Stagnihabitans tardus TaxID=2699202 RepID=A0AAE4YDK3_9RHOB|nr:hypothetical protein [Stagnihabitans tardus]NBZ87645.1 hypothetical protein [Stagnihabitans tardus]